MMVDMILLIGCLQASNVESDSVLSTHPADVCRREERACCGDAECDDGFVCNFNYTCAGLECSDPTGDARCHQACGDEEMTCDDMTQECQHVPHGQGTAELGEVLACF